MKLELRRHFWALNLATIAICAFFAARAVTALVGAALPEARRRTPVALPSAAGALGGSQAREVASILERNIFCSTCAPETPVAVGEGAGGDAPGGDNGEPVKSSLNLRLIATLVSPKDPAWSFAALHDPDQGRTFVHAIGSKVPGNATIEDILDRRVLLRNGGRAEYIELDKGTDNAAPEPAPRPTAPPRAVGSLSPDLAQGVRKLGDNKWEIQRSALNKVLGNTTLLARSARIVPSVRNGKPNGFKLYAIRPGSIYSLIGMQNGDTIHAINGHEMNTPDKALEVYTKVRNASHLSISFSRRGKPQTHDYTIR